MEETMSKRVRRLTEKSLRRIILKEAEALAETLEQNKDDSEKVDAEEVDADKLAGSLEKDIDYMKALKIHEERLKSRLAMIAEAKNVLQKRIIKRI